jgi:hypothetical protein
VKERGVLPERAPEMKGYLSKAEIPRAGNEYFAVAASEMSR